MTAANLTSSELDSIISKVQKLLALSQSSNEHEAGLAASRAQALLFKYNLDMATVESQGAPSLYESHPFWLGAQSKMIEWKRDMVWMLCRYNFCRAVSWAGSKNMSVIGQRHNYEIVLGLYDYLTSAFARLVERAYVSYRLNGGTDQATAYKNAWLRGAVLGVQDQLRAQRKQDAGSSEGSALVIVKDAELDAAFEQAVGKVKTHHSSAPTSASGYLSGRATGQRIALNAQVKGSNGQASSALKG